LQNKWDIYVKPAVATVKGGSRGFLLILAGQMRVPGLWPAGVQLGSGMTIFSEVDFCNGKVAGAAW